jgi:hypothetical protein
MSPLPFSLSPNANAWLSRLPAKPDEELGFVCSPRYGLSSGSEVVELFIREHYAFVHAKPDVWSKDRGAVRFTIGEKAFWFTPDILERLDGKTLDVIRVDVGQGQHRGRYREFLVASAHEEKA